jgi:hypothetical protein
MVPVQAFTIPRGKPFPVGAHDQITRPHQQLQRKTDGVRAAVHGNALVATFPPIAIRAMKHASSIQRRESLDVGNVIHHTGREQQFAAPRTRTVAERDLKSVGQRTRPGGGEPLHRDRVVGHELFESEASQLVRRLAVACQEAVQRMRRGVARAIGVDEEHATTAAAEDKCGTQTCGSAAHDDDFVFSWVTRHDEYSALP